MNLLFMFYFYFSLTFCKKKHYIVKTDKHYIVETKEGHGDHGDHGDYGHHGDPGDHGDYGDYGDHRDLKAEIVRIFNSSQDYAFNCDGVGLLCKVKGMKNIVESGCEFK